MCGVDYFSSHLTAIEQRSIRRFHRRQQATYLVLFSTSGNTIIRYRSRWLGGWATCTSLEILQRLKHEITTFLYVPENIIISACRTVCSIPSLCKKQWWCRDRDTITKQLRGRGAYYPRCGGGSNTKHINMEMAWRSALEHQLGPKVTPISYGRKAILQQYGRWTRRNAEKETVFPSKK